MNDCKVSVTRLLIICERKGVAVAETTKVTKKRRLVLQNSLTCQCMTMLRAMTFGNLRLHEIRTFRDIGQIAKDLEITFR